MLHPPRIGPVSSLQQAAPPPAPVYLVTDGRITRLTKGGASDLGYVGSGLYKPIHAAHDGDNPQSGDPSYPKVGRIDYVGAAGDRLGLQMLGYGIINFELAFTASMIKDFGAVTFHTFIATVDVNAVTRFSFSYTEAKGAGIQTYVWDTTEATGTGALTGSFSILTNDVVSASIHTSTGGKLSAFPIGTGNVDLRLRIYGNLAV